MLKNIQIILCEPSHPGNIGATARAMKNMGLSALTLVSPERYPDAEATSRASGADNILEHATVVTDLPAGIATCQWLFGTSARTREFPWPQMTPRQAASKIIELAQGNQKIGILFGPERAGLSNEALQHCDYHIAIPTHPDYPSLNLSQAVQILCYEIYCYAIELQTSLPLPTNNHNFDKATQEEMGGLLAHFEETAVKLGFMDPEHPKKLLPRLRRLFSKSQLEKDEVNILRGFLKQVQRVVDT
jgi:tRNA (cytidine32/uridine32-2'-O)-methyltransferase